MKIFSRSRFRNLEALSFKSYRAIAFPVENLFFVILPPVLKGTCSEGFFGVCHKIASSLTLLSDSHIVDGLCRRIATESLQKKVLVGVLE